MIRRQCTQRPNWEARVEAQGLVFHTREHPIYDRPTNYRAQPRVIGNDVVREGWWGEGTYYELLDIEVDRIERATAELHGMIEDAVAEAVHRNCFTAMGISPQLAHLAQASLQNNLPSLYSRLDLVFTESGDLKLLEVNGETPTSLLESAVIQWSWLEDVAPGADQFNSLHDKLISRWRIIQATRGAQIVHFASLDELEDLATVAYLADTSKQAGMGVVLMDMKDIGWSSDRYYFADMDERRIDFLFKLYPWVWMMQDEFARHLSTSSPAIIEPAWKAIASSKGILPLLWEMFPQHPLLLPSFYHHNDALVMSGWVRKPMHGREGQNVTVVKGDGVRVDTGGPCTDGPFIIQAYADIVEHDGMRPIIGSWIVGGEPAGIGIRESSGLVTDSTATFVPHLFR